MSELTKGSDGARGRWGGMLLILLGFLGLFHGPVSGQVVLGQLLDADTREPLDGSLVVLLASDGSEVDGYLSNQSGRFRLTSPAAGRFTVRAERIGYETVVSQPFDLVGGQVYGIRLMATQVPIALDELRVQATQRCVIRPSDGAELARLWEEARKTLRVQDFTDREHLLEYRVSNYERELGPGARVVHSEERVVETRIGRIPIRSLPVEDLLADGFIQPLEEGGYLYLGPDAAVLLSDRFLDTHCFKLTERPENPQWIGLEFEPVRRSEVPDVTGVLWLDRGSGEIRTLEFGYTWAPYSEVLGLARGSVEFEGLSTGTWIVRRWWIRMPNVAPFRERTGETTYRLAGFTEAGGEVVRITEQNQTLLEVATHSELSGLVWDSVSARPVEGALVYLSGTQFHTRSDSAGRFHLHGLPEGVFVAAATHPQLDSLGIRSLRTEVTLRANQRSEVELSIPSTETLLAQTCETDSASLATRVLVGQVYVSDSGLPIPEAGVVAMLDKNDEPSASEPSTFVTRTGAEGHFLFCHLPANRPLVLQASFLDQVGEAREITLDAATFDTVHLPIDLPRDQIVFRDSPGQLARSGSDQGLLGRVSDPSTGRPIPNVEVRLQLPSGEVNRGATTNQNGVFRILVPHPGRFTLSASALGFRDLEGEQIKIYGGKLSVVEIEMAADPVALEPLVVVAEARPFYLDVQGFYERAESGLGHFFSPEDLEALQPSQMADLLLRIPGLQVVESDYGTSFLIRKPGAPGTRGRTLDGGLCEPRLIIDGAPIPPIPARNNEGALGIFPDHYVKMSAIAAVEVHLRGTTVPLQFGGSQGDCGVVMIWTKTGG